jgi:hypothetical protein
MHFPLADDQSMPLLHSVMTILRSGYHGPERRKHPRKTIIDTAWIASQDGTPPRVCVVWDISQGGARLTLASDEALPDQFILLESRGDTNGRRCRVVWRSPEHIGIQFLDT